MRLTQAAHLSHAAVRRLTEVLALSAACVGASNATLLSQIDWVSDDAGGGGPAIEVRESTDTNGLISINDPLNAGLGHATAQTDYGVHKVFADTESYAVGPIIYESAATVRSRWADEIVINGGTGSGTVTASVVIDGSLSSSGANASNGASADLLFSLFGPSMTWVSSANGPTEISPNATFKDGVLSASFTFLYGVQRSISSEFVLVAGFGGDGTFDHTVTLYLDLPDGASITSANGVKYNLGPIPSVPEPVSYALMLCGLCVLAAARHLRILDLTRR